MISINYRDARPIYEQLSDNIEKLAIKGILKPDEQLPSVRQLAMDLSINPNTIQRAYTNLDNKGITYSIKGKGSFISNDCTKAKENRLAEIKKEILKLIDEAKDIGATGKTILDWID